MKIIGAMNTVLIVTGFAGLIWWASGQYNELTNQIGVLSDNISRADDVLNRFSDIEKKIANFSIQIEEIDNEISRLEALKKAVEEQSAITNERLSKVESAIVENVGSGVTIRAVECIPLNQRIIVEAERSYDFCDTDWTLQITRITDDQAVIRSNGFRIPSTYVGGLIPDNCELQFLESMKAENSYKVEIRGRCG